MVPPSEFRYCRLAPISWEMILAPGAVPSRLLRPPGLVKVSQSTAPAGLLPAIEPITWVPWPWPSAGPPLVLPSHL